MKYLLWFSSLAIALGLVFVPLTTSAQEPDIRNIIFPVFGSAGFSNDWHAPRSGGRLHQGNDIFAPKHTPLIAAVDGVVEFVPYPQPSYGWMVSIEDDDGYEYWYLHLNNDTPGTDDGAAPPQFAYAFGMRSGWPVKAGQLIGYVGDSGNAESTTSHVHFEIHRPDGKAINPYLSLVHAQRASAITPTPLRNGEIQPFGNFKGGGRIAAGNVDTTSGGEEIVVAAGPGGGPHIRVYSRFHHFLSGFFLPDPSLRSGLDVATGDVNGDGTDEIILGTGPGTESKIYVYRSNGLLLSQFDTFIPQFRGGVNVSAADLNGDGKDEIIAGAGPGGGPEIRIHSITGKLIHSFVAYDRKFPGGVDVAGIDKDVFGRGRIITAPGPRGGPEVRVFDYPSNRIVSAYFAYYREFRGGVRVAFWEDPDDAGEPLILTTPAEGLQSFIHRHTLNRILLEERTMFEYWWLGGFDVTVANGKVYSITGQGRPVSIQSRSY